MTVSYRPGSSSNWRSQTVKVAANGNFTTSWRLAKGANLFVAQWLGNFANAGDGTAALNVQVGPRRSSADPHAAIAAGSFCSTRAGGAARTVIARPPRGEIVGAWRIRSS